MSECSPLWCFVRNVLDGEVHFPLHFFLMCFNCFAHCAHKEIETLIHMGGDNMIKGLVRANEFNPVIDVINELQKELLKFANSTEGMHHNFPLVDVIEYEDKVVIKADLPGVDKNNIKIKISSDSLNISGHIEKNKKESGKSYYIEERVSGEFSKTIPFPSEVNVQKAEAKFENGVLEITVPKANTSKVREIKL